MVCLECIDLSGLLPRQGERMPGCPRRFRTVKKQLCRYFGDRSLDGRGSVTPCEPRPREGVRKSFFGPLRLGYALRTATERRCQEIAFRAVAARLRLANRDREKVSENRFSGRCGSVTLCEPRPREGVRKSLFGPLRLGYALRAATERRYQEIAFRAVAARLRLASRDREKVSGNRFSGRCGSVTPCEPRPREGVRKSLFGPLRLGYALRTATERRCQKSLFGPLRKLFLSDRP